MKLASDCGGEMEGDIHFGGGFWFCGFCWLLEMVCVRGCEGTDLEPFCSQRNPSSEYWSCSELLRAFPAQTVSKLLDKFAGAQVIYCGRRADCANGFR